MTMVEKGREVTKLRNAISAWRKRVAILEGEHLEELDSSALRKLRFF